MRRLEYLFALAGYADDVDRPIAALRKSFHNLVSCEFIGRTYPVRAQARQTHLRDVGRGILSAIFGETAVGFCRKVERPCARDEAGHRARTCQGTGDAAACSRARPDMLVLVCHPRVRDEALDRLGRAALILVHQAETLGDTAALTARLLQELPTFLEIRKYLQYLRRDRLAPLLPMLNYQMLAQDAAIARAVQSDLGSFRERMEAYHARLYDPKFRNPRRYKMQGGYRLNSQVAFQRDLLHTQASHIGTESREDVFHLINAYHLYGVPVLPDVQFDVSAKRGGPLNVVFRDALTNATSNPGACHIDVTPCDRLRD